MTERRDFDSKVLRGLRGLREPRRRPVLDVPSSYVCVGCGEVHAGLPPSIFFPAPLMYEHIAPAQRESRVFVAVEDEAIGIKDEAGIPHLFIRGNLELPVVGADRFGWTLWAEISTSDFGNALKRWSDEGRSAHGPYPGKIACAIPGYEVTLGVAVLVHTQPPGVRPVFEVNEEHPLRTDQRSGISVHRHAELVSMSMGRRQHNSGPR